MKINPLVLFVSLMFPIPFTGKHGIARLCAVTRLASDTISAVFTLQAVFIHPDLQTVSSQLNLDPIIIVSLPLTILILDIYLLSGRPSMST